MTTSPVTLTIVVGQEHATRAGFDQVGPIPVVVRPSELSTAARQVLAALSRPQGVGSLSQHGRPDAPLPPSTEAVHEWLQAYADAEAADRAKAAAVRADTIARYLAAPDEAWLRGVGPKAFHVKHPDTGVEYPSNLVVESRPTIAGYYPSDMSAHQDPAVLARQAEVSAKVKPLIDGANAARARIQEIEAQRKAAAEAEKAAAGHRRATQLQAWLKDRAPETLRRRAARGLLPEDDIVGAIRDEAFAALQDLPRYVRLTDDDVRRELGADDDAEVDYTTRDAATCTDEDLDLIERIERDVPGAIVTLREHVGFLCSATGPNDPEVSRYAVRVALQVGELHLVREYAADTRHA